MEETGIMKEVQSEKTPVFPESIKRTKQREAVYEILVGTEDALSAAEIYRRMQQTQTGCGFAISTVYRALSVFEENGLVSKSVLMGDDTAVYAWNNGTHRHYAICLNCHKRVPLKRCPFENARMNTGNEEFRITGHKVELYGYCKQCNGKAEPQ